jgi:broad specificity phosphatase PhoE
MEYRASQRYHIGESKQVTVLLLRHGEQEDEAMKKAMSMEERKRYSLLPFSIRREYSMASLTRNRYEQASVAWKNILSSLQQRGTKTNLSAVCSPMRRCIGTALMVSPFDTPRNDYRILIGGVSIHFGATRKQYRF